MLKSFIARLFFYLRYPLLILGILIIVGKPIFYVMDSIYQPETHDVVAKETLKKNDNKEIVKDLRNKKEKFDNAGKTNYTRKRITANEYNEEMEEHKDLKIDKYTDLPKELDVKPIRNK